jgi:adenylylsulfate kinase
MPTQRILIMGLPGSGKTFFARELQRLLQLQGHTVTWFNADEVRRQFDDWDFSLQGRIRQSHRMRELADACVSDFALCDFVAPIAEMRDNFAPDWLVWMDTIDQGRFADTNAMFRAPDRYDFRVTEQNADSWAAFVLSFVVENRRRPVFDWRRETVQMLGRWQPWHAGHRALFERALAKTGQVCIMIRDCQGWNQSNPFAVTEVQDRIRRDLDPLYQGQYEILLVPNIVNITYGRDVGYKIEQETFDDAVHAISATKIRREMGIE